MPGKDPFLSELNLKPVLTRTCKPFAELSAMAAGGLLLVGQPWGIRGLVYCHPGYSVTLSARSPRATLHSLSRPPTAHPILSLPRPTNLPISFLLVPRVHPDVPLFLDTPTPYREDARPLSRILWLTVMTYS